MLHISNRTRHKDDAIAYQQALEGILLWFKQYWTALPRAHLDTLKLYGFTSQDAEHEGQRVAVVWFANELSRFIHVSQTEVVFKTPAGLMAANLEIVSRDKSTRPRVYVHGMDVDTADLTKAL